MKDTEEDTSLERRDVLKMAGVSGSLGLLGGIGLGAGVPAVVGTVSETEPDWLTVHNVHWGGEDESLDPELLQSDLDQSDFIVANRAPVTLTAVAYDENDEKWAHSEYCPLHTIPFATQQECERRGEGLTYIFNYDIRIDQNMHIEDDDTFYSQDFDDPDKRDAADLATIDINIRGSGESVSVDLDRAWGHLLTFTGPLHSVSVQTFEFEES